jgi:hypothetical protein
LFSDIILQPHVADQWLWWHDSGGGYSVRGAYNLLIGMDVLDVVVPADLIWHKHVLLKA